MINSFLAKCTASEGQLRDRGMRGAKWLELHMWDNEPWDMAEVSTMTRIILQSGMKVKVVHSSMGRAFIAEALGTEKGKERLALVSQLAQNMSDIHKEKTIVVIHQELIMDQLIDFELMDGIVETMKEMLDRFPDVEYAFENMPIANLEEGRIVVRGSFHEDTPLLAEFLRDKLNTKRVGTVLDTCHMLTSLRVLASISAFGKDVSVTMSDFFDRFKESLFLVHLSNAKNLGFLEEHGAIFAEKEDASVLIEILEHIRRVGFNGPITLEVNEENPLLALKYSHTKNVIESVTRKI